MHRSPAIDWTHKDGRHISTSSLNSERKRKYPGYKRYQLECVQQRSQDGALIARLFILGTAPSTGMEEAGCMTFAAASHQGAIKTLWLYFVRPAMSSIFIYDSNVCAHTSTHKHTLTIVPSGVADADGGQVVQEMLELKGRQRRFESGLVEPGKWEKKNREFTVCLFSAFKHN